MEQRGRQKKILKSLEEKLRECCYGREVHHFLLIVERVSARQLFTIIQGSCT